jgi:hypothetical protein
MSIGAPCRRRWVLEHCGRDAAAGFAVLEATRTLRDDDSGVPALEERRPYLGDADGGESACRTVAVDAGFPSH